MAGIAEQMGGAGPPQSAPQGQPPAAGGQQQEGPGELQAEEATPEEQEQFSRYEAAAQKIIDDKPEVFDRITKMLQNGAEDPVNTLARVALIIFGILDEQTQGGVPEGLIIRVAEVCLDHVVVLAEETGIMEIDINTANDAMLALIEQAGQQYDFDTTELREAVNANPSVASRREAAAQMAQGQQGQPAGEAPPAQEGMV